MRVIFVILCMFMANVCFGLSEEDRLFVDRELDAVRNSPNRGYYHVTRIATKGEDAVAAALPSLLKSAEEIIRSGDKFFVVNLITEVGRFEKQTITKQQYENLERLAIGGGEDVAASLMRAKEKVAE